MAPSLIDTDILSYYFKNNPLVIRRANNYLKEHSFLTISSITYFEILSGLSYRKASRQIEYFEAFIQDCEVLNITEVSIRHSANVSGELRRKGITISNTDLLISGIAIEYGLTLITNNENFFFLNGSHLLPWTG